MVVINRTRKGNTALNAY